MWTRAELKARGKLSFLQNYWKCVLVVIILSILGASGQGQTAGNSAANMSTTGYVDEDGNYQGTEEEQQAYRQYLDTFNYWQSELDNAEPSEYGSIFLRMISTMLGGVPVAIIGFMFIAILILSLGFSIFVTNVIEIGGKQFFIRNAYERANVRELLGGFRGDRYFGDVVTMFLRNLKLFLWTLLLIVPGIIKSYEYQMVPYLLAEYPEMTPREIFRQSKEMMNGQKWNAFVLDLSFIGWHILGVLTLGLADVLWTSPYEYSTETELYLTLKKNVGLTGGFYPEVEVETPASADSWFNPMA